MGLHKPIAYLNKCIRQDFIVTDGICGDPYFEEGGNPSDRNCIMVSKDPVLTDAYGCSLLGLSPEDVPYITLAALEKAGSCSLKDLVLTDITDGAGNNISLSDKGIRSPQISNEYLPLELNYATTEIESCSACYSALTDALFNLKKDKLLDDITNVKGYRFSIGQGFRGTFCSDEKNIGIGSCTGGFAHNIPGCPPSAQDILNYLQKL